MTEVQYTYKIVIIGDASVGKTALITRLIEDSFTAEYKSTIGSDIESKIFFIDGKKIKLNFWDLAGQERFKSMVPMYFKGAKGCLLVFDSTRQTTFESYHSWIGQFDDEQRKNIPMYLVASKCDKSSEKFYKKRTDIYTETVQRSGIFEDFIETSSKTGKNVKKLFKVLADKVHENHAQECRDQNMQQKTTVNLAAPIEKKNKKCSC